MLREKSVRQHDKGPKYRCVVNIGFQKTLVFKFVIGRGPNDNNYYNLRRIWGVRKEENQQGGTNTLARTVKETHNIMLWEKKKKNWPRC